MSFSLERMRFYLRWEKTRPGQRRQSADAKARKRGSSCIIKDKRITLSNMKDCNFSRDVPRFSYQCNGESFTPGFPTARACRRGGRKSHVRETRHRKRRLDRTYARANAHAVTYAELGRRVQLRKTGERATARVRGIVEQLARMHRYFLQDKNTFL